jgi:hypothetical protein
MAATWRKEWGQVLKQSCWYVCILPSHSYVWVHFCAWKYVAKLRAVTVGQLRCSTNKLKYSLAISYVGARAQPPPHTAVANWEYILQASWWTVEAWRKWSVFCCLTSLSCPLYMNPSYGLLMQLEFYRNWWPEKKVVQQTCSELTFIST